MLKFKASPEAQKKINQSGSNAYARRDLWRLACRAAVQRTGKYDRDDEVVLVGVGLRDVLSALEERRAV